MADRISRREMLRKTALAGVGLWAARRSVWADIKSPNEKLNVAIIGAGGQGGGNTGAVASENIVALCDVDERRAAGTFQRFPKAKRYADFRKMLDEIHKQVDAVVVSTPDHTHAVAAVPAMKLGKHAYCEKPLTRTVYEARMMREAAAEHNVVTQMGNQGSASEGLRRAVEMAWAGVAGEVREAHVWFGGGNSPQDRPKDQPPVPAGLHWDLWLGPAPYRPYHPTYAPASWRNWRAFGTGSLGDFGCHTMNLAFRALRLDLLWNPSRLDKSPSQVLIRVEAEASEVHPETYSRWVIVRYEFPARGKLPPIKVTWYNGGPKPPQDLLLGHPMTGSGCLLVGSKGAIFSECPWNTRFVLLPEKQFEGIQGPPLTLPRSPGHHAEWIRACKGGAKPLSSFDIGGPLAEVILLSIAALLVGHPIEYDPLSGKIVNCAEANRFLHREYRSGWSL
ncbi:Gfo/Idh/MocA family oxidoreductase [bacterium]|nr:Gfo/Idh/MocA family oxidoreductase [bacterium]